MNFETIGSSCRCVALLGALTLWGACDSTEPSISFAESVVDIKWPEVKVGTRGQPVFSLTEDEASSRKRLDSVLDTLFAGVTNEEWVIRWEVFGNQISENRLVQAKAARKLLSDLNTLGPAPAAAIDVTRDGSGLRFKLPNADWGIQSGTELEIVIFDEANGIFRTMTLWRRVPSIDELIGE